MYQGGNVIATNGCIVYFLKLACWFYFVMVIMLIRALCQKQVSGIWTGYYIPQVLWDVITCPCPSCRFLHNTRYSKVHGANMEPIWVVSSPGGTHSGPMNLAIRDSSVHSGLMRLIIHFPLDASLTLGTFADCPDVTEIILRSIGLLPDK